MKRLILVSILFCSFYSAFTQVSNYGKINEADWNINHCGFDSTANTVVLFDGGNIKIEANNDAVQNDPDCKLRIEYFLLTYERHLRIKILGSGSDNSISHSFRLPAPGNIPVRLMYFKSSSVYKGDGHITVEKFNTGNLRKSTSADGINEMTFELNGLKNGTIIDINYRIESAIHDTLPEWNLTNQYPTLYSEINITTPDFFRFGILSDILNKLNYKSFVRDKHYTVSYPIQNGWSDVNYIFNENHETYSLRNIPAISETENNHSLKYNLKSIDFNSVYYKKAVWIRQ
jgi:hypothetical protein